MTPERGPTPGSLGVAAAAALVLNAAYLAAAAEPSGLHFANLLLHPVLGLALLPGFAR